MVLPLSRLHDVRAERKALMAVRPFVPGAEDELDRSIRTTAYGELQFQRSIEFIRIRMLFS